MLPKHKLEHLNFQTSFLGNCKVQYHFQATTQLGHISISTCSDMELLAQDTDYNMNATHDTSLDGWMQFHRMSWKLGGIQKGGMALPTPYVRNTGNGAPHVRNLLTLILLVHRGLAAYVIHTPGEFPCTSQ